jgi:anti-sigma regulatory factor (Ser/Thr protein kinase)
MSKKKQQLTNKGANTKATKAKTAPNTLSTSLPDTPSEVGIGMPVTKSIMKKLKEKAKKL